MTPRRLLMVLAGVIVALWFDAIALHSRVRELEQDVEILRARQIAESMVAL